MGTPRRTARGTPLAPFQVAIGPAGGIISGQSLDIPRRGHARACGDVRLGSHDIPGAIKAGQRWLVLHEESTDE